MGRLQSKHTSTSTRSVVAMNEKSYFNRRELFDIERRCRDTDLVGRLVYLLKDACKQPILGRSAGLVVDNVAQRELDPVLVGDDRRRWANARRFNQEALGDRNPCLLGRLHVFAHDLLCHSLNKRARQSIIAAILDRDHDLVPEKGKLGGVVEHRLLKNEAIGHPHDTPIVLIGVHPFADLHDGGAQNADVDHVALDAAKLHSVADLVEATE